MHSSHQRAPKQNPAAWRSGEAPSPRRHDLAFHVLTAYCLVPQIEMPFGKNKQLAYKRPKKGKVPAREESSENTENAGINGGGQPPPAPACVEQPLAASPGWLKRKQAQVECDDLRIEFEAHQRLDAEAEKELHMQERLYEAKQRRIEKSKAGKRHGSPFGQLRISTFCVGHEDVFVNCTCRLIEKMSTCEFR